MRRQTLQFLVIFAFVAISGCQTSRPDSGAATAVRAVLERQVHEWNSGNLAGFMDAYARSDNTRFASGGNLSIGWQTVFDRYRNRYSDRAAMGTLTFSHLEITVLGPNAALAFGRWRLKRDKDEPAGLFTLLLRKTSQGWRVVHDHTSAAEAN